MTTIERYINGNCAVSLSGDGTKVREWEGDARPVYPESVDLKITDWCDAGCPWCHESSTTRGQHASPDAVFALLADAPAGMEVAVGGGDPLSHPDLRTILRWMRVRRLVPNLTVNARHLGRHAEMIAALRADGLVFGVGVSWVPGAADAVASVADGRTVVHVIAGVDPLADVFLLHRRGIRQFLVLGYKTFGRGIRFFSPEINFGLSRWRYWIGTLLRMRGSLSFDNLALEQLQIRQRVTAKTWNSHYMGDDGTFTMYADAVADSFAATSTLARVPRGGLTLREMFAAVRH